jgi:hypothetical protein
MLPYQTRVFHSALPVAQARASLQDAIAPVLRGGGGREGGSFEGVVEGDTFRIHRAVRGRNSFRPMLHGRIETTPSGRARIVVSFRLHPIVAVFMAVWLGITGSLTLIGIQEAAATGEREALRHVGGMFALGFLMLFGGFAIEAHKAAGFMEAVFGDSRAPARPGFRGASSR